MRVSRALRALAGAAVLALTLGRPGSVLAQEPPGQIDVAAIVGSGPLAALPGMTEIYVRVQNPGSRPLSGFVSVASSSPDRPDPVQTAAPFQVAANGTAVVKVPVYVETMLDVRVDTNGSPTASFHLTASEDGAVRIFDVHDAPRFGSVLDSVPINTVDHPVTPYAAKIPGPPPPTGAKGSKVPMPTSKPAVGSITRLRIHKAATEQTTGAPILPNHVATWHGVHVVLMPTSKLVALKGEELEALAGFVLGGGTLALSVTRPEDLRHATVVAFTGAEAHVVPCTEACVPPFIAPALPMSVATSADLPNNVSIPEGLKFTAYEGGNTHPSMFGGTAVYGLGQVVLFGFDITDPSVADMPWVEVRIAELARQAFDRKVNSLVRLGEPPPRVPSGPFGTAPEPYEEVRRLLDPNRTARWGVGIAALIICLYAILAGPVAFTGAKKRNKPLWALVALPILSFLTFVTIVVIGIGAKGIGKTSRRLTVVDAGAGMPRGVSRRYRAFFSSTGQTVSTGMSERTSSLVLAMGPRVDHGYTLDGDGLRARDVEAMPAQTILFREDGLTSIGDGISITKSASDGQITVTNRTGLALSPVLVKLDDDTFRLVAELADGASIASGAMDAGSKRFQSWARTAVVPTASGASLGAPFLSAMDDEHQRDFGMGWSTFERASLQGDIAFPPGVPVVLAGATLKSGARDSGVEIVDDRMLLRVVGFGGTAP
ncbi:MAG: hypothetical protein U0271_13065 [Polyangiaceae bacterium]